MLLINFPSLDSFDEGKNFRFTFREAKINEGKNFRFIFREAKINDAILFFDECEAIFESRKRGSHDVNMLLTEIERSPTFLSFPPLLPPFSLSIKTH